MSILQATWIVRAERRRPLPRADSRAIESDDTAIGCPRTERRESARAGYAGELREVRELGRS